MMPVMRATVLAVAVIALVAAFACARGSAALADDPPMTAPKKIMAIYDCKGKDCKPVDTNLGLGDKIVVGLDGTEVLIPKNWVLYLDGRSMVDPATAVAVHDNPRGLVFSLKRGDKDRPAWAQILGAPWNPVPVEVSVGRTDANGSSSRLTGDSGHPAEITLDVLGTSRLALAVGIGLLVLLLLAVAAVSTGILRDHLVPAIPPLERPLSLGRCQMAFWFTLIFIAFLFLWALLLDYNTLSSQSLVLMGISAATGLGAVAANSTNTDKLDSAIRALEAQGFTSPTVIVALRDKLKENQTAQANRVTAGQPADPVLDQAISDALAKKQVYDTQTKDYVSATFDEKSGATRWGKAYLDVISDQDGPALSRVQVVGWTLALGLVFVVGVYQDLAMPAFDPTLLALMAVSGASYVGFKINAVA
jgi:hypothetical protein